MTTPNLPPIGIRQPGGYKFVTQPKKSIPVGNSAKFVLPVRISRPPVTSNLPKLKAKPTGTSSQSQGNWREEINREIEMCEFYDNLPPIQQMAFKKMMHRMGEPMPAPILQSHPPCSEDELSRPRSPLMIPARLLRSYQKKKQQTNIVSGVDRPQSDVVSESFDISEPGPSTSEPLFRSEIKEEVVAENEITRNSNGEGASYTVQTVSSRLLPHYDPTQTMLKKSQGINNYLNKISVPSRIETSPLEDVKPLVPPHRIKAPVVQEKSGFTFKRVKFDKEDLQRPYQTVRTDLLEDEKPPTIDSMPTKFTRSAGIVEQSNTLPESLFSDFKNYKSHTIKAPKNVRICRSPDGDSLLPLLDDSYALNFPDEALAHNPEEVAPSKESTTALPSCFNDMEVKEEILDEDELDVHDVIHKPSAVNGTSGTDDHQPSTSANSSVKDEKTEDGLPRVASCESSEETANASERKKSQNGQTVDFVGESEEILSSLHTSVYSSISQKCKGCQQTLLPSTLKAHEKDLKEKGTCMNRRKYDCPYKTCDDELDTLDKLCVHLLFSHQKPAYVQERTFKGEQELKLFIQKMKLQGNYRTTRGTHATTDGNLTRYHCCNYTAPGNTEDEFDDARLIDRTGNDQQNERKGVVCSSFFREIVFPDGHVRVRYCDYHLHGPVTPVFPIRLRNRIAELGRYLPPAGIQMVIEAEAEMFAPPLSSLYIHVKNIGRHQVLEELKKKMMQPMSLAQFKKSNYTLPLRIPKTINLGIVVAMEELEMRKSVGENKGDEDSPSCSGSASDLVGKMKLATAASSVESQQLSTMDLLMGIEDTVQMLYATRIEELQKLKEQEILAIHAATSHIRKLVETAKNRTKAFTTEESTYYSGDSLTIIEKIRPWFTMKCVGEDDEEMETPISRNPTNKQSTPQNPSATKRKVRLESKPQAFRRSKRNMEADPDVPYKRRKASHNPSHVMKM